MRLSIIDRLNTLLVVVCSTVGQVVSVDHCDDGVTQIHRFHSIGQVFWLIEVKGRRRFDGANRTESAPSGAFLACDHKGCITACPAVVNVGAAGFLADRVQRVVFHGCFCAVENRLLFA